MVTIYQDYQDEPADVFLALPEHLACSLYALEMDKFTEDCIFFERMLPHEGLVLEMGCGTGRVARSLAKENRPMIGIDISLPMLQVATQNVNPFTSFCCMDMLSPGFRTLFDAILIPYNTLNLLVAEEKILRCLIACREYLRSNGALVVQLFIPTEDFLGNSRTTFQFQMFDRPGGGRIIKEILKKYLPESQTVQLEERFRIRPMQEGQANEDYRAITCITAFSLAKWLALFAADHLTPVHICGSYDGGAYDANVTSHCLLVLKRQEFSK